jgi:hypothetical protein
MALVLKDRVKETTTTTGTGTVTLLGAATGFQSFSAIGDGNTTYYTIVSQLGSEWEVGIGTYTSSGTTLSRTTVLSSSNSGSLVVFTAGTKDVFVTYPSSRSVYADGTTLTASNSSVLPIANGGTGRSVGNYSVFANEIHVSKDGNDTTGDGTVVNPVLTITKALTLVAGLKKTVVVHPGDYPESPTISTANTTLATTELTGANTTISGTLTTSAAARISGLKMSNLTITGSGATYVSNCTVDTQVIKSGSNYVEIINSELQCTLGVQITGAGAVSIVGNKCWAVAVSNASASVLIKDCFQVITSSVTAGTLQFDGCAIFAASPASNAVTSSAGTFITLANSFVLNSAGSSVERVSLAGSYSIVNLVYDKTNSTFAGTNLNAIDYFSVINADTLVLTNKLAIANGGTNTTDTPLAGRIAYGTGLAIAYSPQSIPGQLLQGNGISGPTWVNAPTGTVTSVAATVPSFLSITGSPITSSGTLAITYSGTALPIANGGTGQTTANTAFNALAPSQTSNTGKYLTTNGTDTSWATVTSAGITFVNAISSPVTTAITISANQLGLSLGPIVIGSGGSVTVDAGQQWVVL